jgi:transaldolase
MSTQPIWPGLLDRLSHPQHDQERRAEHARRRARLAGVTSNPAIFHKAIAGSNEYDAQIQHLVHEGLAIHDIYEQLIVTDIQEACDILRSVYDASDRMDS